MSDENQIALIPIADFTIKDLETIQKFKDEGMIGLHTLTDVDVERMMALYVDGRSYRQISQVLKRDKTVIMFLSHKFKWFEIRKNYLDELQATVKDKVIESKLKSKQFLLDLISVYQKKIGKNFNDYIRTDDEKFADKIDVKDVNTILKVMDLLHKLDNDKLGDPNDKGSLVGFNGVGEGMTITKVSDNSVEITPTKAPTPFQSKLKQFAELKREQERASQPPIRTSHDIIVDQPLTEKEEEDESH